MKQFLRLIAAGLTLAAAASHAPAQSSYPTQPVRWIVPYVAGGGTDNLARALAEAMTPSLGQPIITDTPMLVEAPGRLSMMMGWPSDGVIASASARARLSVPPPAT